MKVSNISPYSGKVNSMDLDITASQWARYCAGGGYIQDIFPNLTADQREFIKTGLYPGEWEEIFNDKD
jgi:hypothetical protein